LNTTGRPPSTSQKKYGMNNKECLHEMDLYKKFAHPHLISKSHPWKEIPSLWEIKNCQHASLQHHNKQLLIISLLQLKWHHNTKQHSSKFTKHIISNGNGKLCVCVCVCVCVCAFIWSLLTPCTHIILYK